MTGKRGRPPIDNARNVRVNLRVTQDEKEMIEKCSKKINHTMTDTILLAVSKLLKTAKGDTRRTEKTDGKKTGQK